MDMHSRDINIYQILKADSTLMNIISGIFDRIPQSAAFPYITLGDATDKTFILNVWVREKGRKEATILMERIYDLLNPFYHFVSSNLTLEADGWTFKGQLKFSESDKP